MARDCTPVKAAMAHPNNSSSLSSRALAKWLRPATLAVLSVAILGQAAEISWHVWGALRPVAEAHRADGSAGYAAPSPQKIEDLVAAHLFGRSPGPEQEAQASSTAPERWVLTGTLQGETATSGAAILGDTAATTRYRAVGHEVGGGFLLTEVFTRVVATRPQ